MNERIRQLAEQASHQSPDGYPVTIPYSKDFAEKFAELIVRECLNIVEPVEDSGDEWCITLKETAQEIKEHFGVKE